MLDVEGLAICGPEEPYKGKLPVVRFRPPNGEVFGVGWHPSTQEALRRLRAAITPECSVLDVGTGTGILAIAALRWGAGRVTAVERDPTAYAYAQQAFTDNSVGVVLVRELAEVPDCYDVVVANLGNAAAAEIAPELQWRLSQGGTGIWELDNG